MTRTIVYPLVLEPILKEKVWGGRRLEHYGKVLAAGSQVGESCGSMIHDGQLVLPYGFSDIGARIALVSVDELLTRLTGQ